MYPESEPQAEQVEIKDTQVEQQVQPDPPSMKLWKGLKKMDLYSKDYPTFLKQYSDPSEITRLHKGLIERDLYSNKDESAFVNQYFPELKKKDQEQAVPPSGVGSPVGASQLESTTPPVEQENPKVGAEQFSIADAKVLPEVIIGTQKKEPPVENILDASIQYNTLKNSKVSGGEVSVDVSGDLSYPEDVPNENDRKKAAEIKKNYPDVNLDDLYENISKLNENDYKIPGFSKQELQEDYLNNKPNFYNKINDRVWKNGFTQELTQNVADGFINKQQRNDIVKNINYSLDAIGKPNLTFDEDRKLAQSLSNTVQEYGGQQRFKLLTPLATSLADVYGNAFDRNFDKTYASAPESKYLTPNELLAYYFKKDINPEKAKQFENLFINVDEIKNDPNALKGYDKLKLALNEEGISLQMSSVDLRMNKLESKAKQSNNQLSPEDFQEYEKLKGKKEDLINQSEELDEKYPELSVNKKVNEGIQEIIGQQFTGLGYTLGKTAESIVSGAESIGTLVATPFLSDKDTKQMELSILGEPDNIYSSQSTRAVKTAELTMKPELKAEVDKIVNDPNLDWRQKRQKLWPLLEQNKNDFGMIPIKDGKTDINPTTVFYSVSDLASSLAPFFLVEAATGGVGGTGMAARFLRSANAAFTTGFKDVYKNEIASGNADPMKRAFIITAVNAGAMAGAGTLGNLKEIYKNNPVASKIISKMTNAEYEAALKSYPEVWNKTIQKLNIGGRLKALPKQYLAGVKSGLEFETLMEGADKVKELLNLGEEGDKSGVKQAVVNAFIGFPAFHVITAQAGYKSPTDIDKGSFLLAGRNPNDFLFELDQMKKNGEITEQQYSEAKTNINKTAEVFKKIGFVNAKGEKLSEKDQSELLFLKLQEKDLDNEIKKDLPDSVRKKLGEQILDIKDKVNDIYEGNLIEKKPETTSVVVGGNVEKGDMIMNKDGRVGEVVDVNEKGDAIVVDKENNLRYQWKAEDIFKETEEETKAREEKAAAEETKTQPTEETITATTEELTPEEKDIEDRRKAAIAEFESNPNLTGVEGQEVLVTPEGTISRETINEQFDKEKEDLSKKQTATPQEETPSPKVQKLRERMGLGTTEAKPKRYTMATIKTIDTTPYEGNAKVVAQGVKNMMKAVAGLVSKATGEKLNVNLHDTPESYIKGVLEAGGTDRDFTSKGFYFGKNGSVHLNMSAVTPDTGAHEFFHPVLDYMAIKRPDIINSLHIQLSKLDQGAKIINENNIKYKDKSKETQQKEAITDYIARVASGQIKLDKTNWEAVKDFVITALNKVGLNLSKDINSIEDLQQLAKQISRQFKSGQELRGKDLRKDKLVGQEKPSDEQQFAKEEKKLKPQKEDYEKAKKIIEDSAIELEKYPEAVIPKVQSTKNKKTGEEKIKIVVTKDKKSKERIITPQYKVVSYDLEKGALKHIDKNREKAIDNLSNGLVKDYLANKDRPEILAAIGWYGNMRRWFQRNFGANIEMFGQLLAATSARTEVMDNFKQSVDAFKNYSKGKYNDLLEDYDRHVKEIKSMTDEQLLAKWKEKNPKKRLSEFDADDYRRFLINQYENVPLRSNGKKFNANSKKVLQALYGNWIEQTKGPKTKNFAGNLTGRSYDATIDVWAARYLRRKIFGDAVKRWRILPQSEGGVKFGIKKSGEMTGDYPFAEEVMRKAADKLGIKADDLQAFLWYLEKDVWGKNGWTTETGKKKASFEEGAETIDSERYQAAVTTFRDVDPFDPVKFEETRKELEKEIANLPGVIAARITPSTGEFLDETNADIEPTFDVEFTVDKGSDVSSIIEKIDDIQIKYNQKATIFSKTVDENHPNARPIIEVGLAVPTESSPIIEDIKNTLANLNVRGFTISKDSRGKILGFRAQFVPEFEEGVTIPKGIERFVKAFEEITNKYGDSKDISYLTSGFVDSRVKFNPKNKKNEPTSEISTTEQGIPGETTAIEPRTEQVLGKLPEAAGGEGIRSEQRPSGDVSGMARESKETGGKPRGLDNIGEKERETIKYNYEDSFGLNDFDWNKESSRENFREWLKDFENKQFNKNLPKVIKEVKEDIELLKQKELSSAKLQDFEDLIIPSLGNEALVPILSKFEEDILLDPNLTLEKMEEGFKEAKNIIDEDGSLNMRKIEPSEILNKEKRISLPGFERFVEKNPDFKGVFDAWKKIFDEDIRLTLEETNAYRTPSIKELENLYNELIKQQDEGLSLSRDGEGKSELQKFVEEERAAGTSDAEIRTVLEEFAKDPESNLDAAKIDELMASPKVEEEVKPEPSAKPKPGKKTAKIETDHPYLYEGSSNTRVRGIMSHIADAQNISKKTKEGFGKEGARYKVANNAEARLVAKDIIKAFGKNDALTIARTFDLHPSVRSAIFAESIDNAYRAGKKARTKEDKLIAATEWKDLVEEYGRILTESGQFTAYSGHFYKTSPMGFVMAENDKTEKRFEEFISDKKESFDELWNKLNETEGGKLKIQEEVEKLRKKERVSERKKNAKNIDDFFNKMKEKGSSGYGDSGTYFSRQTPGSSPAPKIPKDVWDSAMDTMNNSLQKDGDLVEDAVQKAIDIISESIGDKWNKDKFRSYYQELVSRVADGNVKEKSTEELIKKRITDLENQIDEYKKKIEQGGVPGEKRTEKFADVEEINKLKEERDELRKENERLLKEAKIGKYSDAEKLKAAEKAAQDSIKELERKINENDLEFKKVENPTSADLDAYRNKQKELRKELDKKRKEAQVGKYDPAKIAADRAKRIQDRIAELNRRIAEGDFSAEQYKAKKEKDALDIELENAKKLYDEAKKQSPEYQEKKAKQFLENFKKRIEGVSEEKKAEIVRRAIKKIIDSGGLEEPEFKDLVADVMGFKKLSDTQAAEIEDLNEKINRVTDLEDAMVEDPTPENIAEYEAARIEGMDAAMRIFNMTHKEADIAGTLKSLVSGGLLGVPTLIMNVGQNVITNTTIRLPKAVIKQMGDLGIYGVSALLNQFKNTKIFFSPSDLIKAQEGYFKMGKKGLQLGAVNFMKGTQMRDYLSETSYQSTLAPKKAIEDLRLWRAGEKYLTKAEVIDKYIKASIVSKQANFILKGMGFGDLPFRWAAEGATAIQIATKELKLTDANEIEAFMLSPQKYAYKVFIKEGDSAEKAAQKSEEIKERILYEGKKAVFEEDNLLTMANSAVENLLKSKGEENAPLKVLKPLSSVLKTSQFPFLKIPSNIAWQYFKVTNPELSLAYGVGQLAIASYYSKKGNIKEARAYYERAKDSFATAILGYGVAVAASSIVSAGLVRSSNDEDNKIRETTGEKTYGKQNQLNFGKLIGGKDYWVDLKWYGALGSMLNTKAKITEAQLEKKLKGDTTLANEFVDDLGFSATSAMDGLIFDQGARIVDAIKGGNAGKTFLSSQANTLESVFFGATFTAISKAALPEEVRLKGDNVIEEINNNMKARNLFYRFAAGYPPSRVSIWGEPIKKDNTVSGMLGNMFGFQKGSSDLFGAILYDEARRTGDPRFFPMPEDNKIKVNEKEIELTQKEKDELDTYIGQYRKVLVSSFIYDMGKVDNKNLTYDDKKYSQLNDTEKIEALNYLYEAAREAGFNKFVEARQDNPLYKTAELDLDKEMAKKYKEINAKFFKKDIETILEQPPKVIRKKFGGS